MAVDVDLLAQSRALIEAGDMAVAERLLAEALGVVAADPAEADEQTAEAAALRTGVLLALGEPYAARGWAAYGHAAHRHLHGETDRRTLHMLGLLAAVLSRVGSHQRAAQRYHQLIAVLRTIDGPDGDRVLAARADLATVEHARGQCTNARLHLSIVLAEHQARHGAEHPLGIRMQARLAAMWRDCGDFDHAHLLFAEARGNAAQLPPTDPVHQLLTALARAAADPRHRCGFDALARESDAPAGTTLLDEPGRSGLANGQPEHPMSAKPARQPLNQQPSDRQLTAHQVTDQQPSDQQLPEQQQTTEQPAAPTGDQLRVGSPLPRRTPAPRERMALPLSSVVPVTEESDGRPASALDMWPTRPTSQRSAPERHVSALPDRLVPPVRSVPTRSAAHHGSGERPVTVEAAVERDPVSWSDEQEGVAATAQQVWEQPVVSVGYHGLADQEPLHDPTSPWLHAPLWASMSYLPEHPDVSARQPAQIITPTRQQRQRQPLNVVLVASIIGIVAITVLFMLVVSAARPG